MAIEVSDFLAAVNMALRVVAQFTNEKGHTLALRHLAESDTPGHEQAR